MGKAAEHQAGRHAHARQYQRIQCEVTKLRTWLGRVIRDVQRKAGEITGVVKTPALRTCRFNARKWAHIKAQPSSAKMGYSVNTLTTVPCRELTLATR